MESDRETLIDLKTKRLRSQVILMQEMTFPPYMVKIHTFGSSYRTVRWSKRHAAICNENCTLRGRSALADRIMPLLAGLTSLVAYSGMF